MSMRDKLIADMNAYSAECKWDESLQQIMAQILQVRPQNPYAYIQKKLSLRSKFDNSKISAYLNEITMYITSVNPLLVNQEQFTNKITYICVQKYQHTKIKSTQMSMVENEVMGFMSSILITQQEKYKQQFLKMTAQITQKQSYTIMELANILYYTTVYLHALKEIIELEQKLVAVYEHIDKQLLRRYIHTVNPQISIIKSQALEIEGEADIFKCIAHEIVDRIKS